MLYASPVLPIGRINLTTGKSKWFNIYQTWGENTTYELYDSESKSSPGKRTLRLVATSGKEPLRDIGETGEFHHDQTGAFLFFGKMIDFAVGSNLKELVEKYGNSIWGYTYK